MDTKYIQLQSNWTSEEATGSYIFSCVLLCLNNVNATFKWCLIQCLYKCLCSLCIRGRDTILWCSLSSKWVLGCLRLNNVFNWYNTSNAYLTKSEVGQELLYGLWSIGLLRFYRTSPAHWGGIVALLRQGPYLFWLW